MCGADEALSLHLFPREGLQGHQPSGLLSQPVHLIAAANYPGESPVCVCVCVCVGGVIQTRDQYGWCDVFYGGRQKQ